MRDGTGYGKYRSQLHQRENCKMVMSYKENETKKKRLWSHDIGATKITFMNTFRVKEAETSKRDGVESI